MYWREEVPHLACNTKRAFFASVQNIRILSTCQKVTEALVYLLDNLYIRFGSKLERENVGILEETHCSPLFLIFFHFD